MKSLIGQKQNETLSRSLTVIRNSGNYYCGYKIKSLFHQLLNLTDLINKSILSEEDFKEYLFLGGVGKSSPQVVFNPS
jgi:hypothetical protein